MFTIVRFRENVKDGRVIRYDPEEPGIYEKHLLRAIELEYPFREVPLNLKAKIYYSQKKQDAWLATIKDILDRVVHTNDHLVSCECVQLYGDSPHIDVDLLPISE